MILQKHKVANVPDVLYFYRANPNSVGSSFKDYRSKVLHNLTVKLFKLRNSGKDDPILMNNYKLADKHCEILLLIEEAKKKKIKALSKSIKLFFLNINLVKFYFKDFLYSLIKS